MDGRVDPEIRAAAGGLVAVDPVRRRRVSLSASGPVDPEPVDPDGFGFPVDVAVAVTTAELAVPYGVGTYVRDGAGDPVADVTAGEETFPPGEYVVELWGPVKLFVRAAGAPTVTAGPDRTAVAFGEETRVRVGARSYHDRPAATVTTTAAPRDLMAAVSTFGSALKTTSPERSFPTLRGHPPALRLGERLSVPDGLAPPETGVRVEVPPDREAVYVVAPLAHYLGARVVEGDPPRLTAGGFVHRLGGGDRCFEREVARVLRQTLLLDCVVRTEGYYPVALHERTLVEDHLDRSPAELYDARPADRLRAYLSVPYGAVRDAVPGWRLAAHVTAEPSCAELLAPVVDDLAVVRTAAAAGPADPAAVALPIEDFVRGSRETDGEDGSRDGEDGSRDGEDGARDAGRDASAVGGGSDAAGVATYVSPVETGALTDAWLAGGRPVGANKLTAAGVANRLARSDPSGDVDVVLVCNDPEMAGEADDGLYGGRTDLPFDVTVRENCGVAELRETLALDVDFLHYVGHVDAGGLRCRDGHLAPGDVGTVGPAAFLLNGCRSYEPGLALVEAGAAAGVVTYSDVGNEDAVAVGRVLAKLLNAGFSLRAAVSIARRHGVVGDHYVTVGDGGVGIAHPESMTSTLLRVGAADDGFEVQPVTYPTGDLGMGSLFRPTFGDVEPYFLAGGNCPPVRLGKEELLDVLRREEVPVAVDGRLVRSTELAAEDLP